MSALSRSAEIDRILSLYGSDAAGMMAMLERQFAVLHNRSQVLLGLCGIVISSTGFSGRAIAGTGFGAKVLVITGVALVMLSAALVAVGVQHLWWLSQQPGADTRAWLEASLNYRDRKTNFYRVALIVMIAGLACYVAAIAWMLGA
jgi:hypothetical protein